MSDRERWQRDNGEYLAAALEWLRRRLAGVAGAAGAETTSRHDRAAAPSPAPAGAGDSDADLRRRVEALARSTKPAPAMRILAQRFGLSPFEQNVLLLCAGMELDTRIAELCARAQGDPARPYPTFALAMALFEDAAWEILSPERPLRFWRLIEINQPAAEPLTTSALRADERIVNFIKGLNYLDDRLAPLLVPFDLAGESAAELPPSQLQATDRVIRHLTQAWRQSASPIIQLLGTDPLSKQLVARNVAARSGLDLYRLPVELLPKEPADLVTLGRLWHRESILLPVALYLDAHELDQPQGSEPPAGSPATPARRFLTRSAGVFFVAVREVFPGLGPTSPAVEIRKPTASEQQRAWLGELEGNGSGAPALLAGQFDLNVATIRHIARFADAKASGNGHLAAERAWQACLASTRPRMDLLAERLEPKAIWDDIVLAEEAERLLREIADQVRTRGKVYDEWGFRAKMSRGLGINALFAGDSGTGKTMAAEVLANELRLNLYRIDLSAVVSKYIGETEKNLRQLFDAAEDGGAILFFDEADALFGKRSEVKDSHDRYANIEVNYLLQRMEAFRGLAILATNLRSALDHAFLRRLRFIVTFAFPGVEQRKEIWRKVFPPETPTEDLDIPRLARLNLTGGSIHNVALNAAFVAAQRNRPVSMPLVLSAARAEFRKMERPINEADFRWEGPREVVA